MDGAVERGREAFARRAWAEAHALLGAGGSSEAGDLERLAVAAHLVGRDDDSVQAWTLAHAEWLRLRDPGRAVRCAFWASFAFLLRGETARADGWLARAERLVEQSCGDCAERGLLRVPVFMKALGGGDHVAAAALADEILEIAQRSEDVDVQAFGLLCGGEAALATGGAARGMTLLDEVMVVVTVAEVSPITAGIVYCAVLEACVDAYDLRRAREWTGALQSWCEAQPDLVPFRGQCLVHRSQILLAHGEWSEAVVEADRALRRLSDPPHPALGMALYQRGELHRLRGELDDAEQAYREAGRHGLDPAPGMALLRVAQGNVHAATGAIRRVLEDGPDPPTRPVTLAAAVEVLLAAGDIEGARAAGARLTAFAESLDAPLLRAVADFALGSVLLAEKALPEAAAALRRACAGWLGLGMPYDAARARVRVALVCRDRGDHDAAALELDAARAAFDRLGARPDLARVAELSTGRPRPDALTERECEVLRLVATGRTNREIASELVISEHTVARHLQNMFVKLELASRAAATAYAYEHGLV